MAIWVFGIRRIANEVINATVIIGGENKPSRRCVSQVSQRLVGYSDIILFLAGTQRSPNKIFLTQCRRFHICRLGRARCRLGVIHVIAAIPACPVRAKSGHWANARVYECTL
jgi:hypothetical protein